MRLPHGERTAGKGPVNRLGKDSGRNQQILRNAAELAVEVAHRMPGLGLDPAECGIDRRPTPDAMINDARRAKLAALSHEAWQTLRSCWRRGCGGVKGRTSSYLI